VLEEAGLAVQLVNSSQARNLPGRPKTDKEDARWIARLTEMGMLRSSFVPPPEIRALRVYTRHIWDLTADRTRYWQRSTFGMMILNFLHASGQRVLEPHPVGAECSRGVNARSPDRSIPVGARARNHGGRTRAILLGH
jgi:hypothetical protein